MRITARYFAKRLAFAVLTFWVALTADFILPRLVGGNAAEAIASQTALGSQQVTALLEKEFGLTNPNILYQYWRFIVQLLHGNLGVSYQYYPAPVTTLLIQALPFTVGLVTAAIVITFLVGGFLGMVAAWRAHSRLDQWIVSVSYYLSAVPYFWIAMLLILLFAFHLRWFPLGQALPIDTETLSPFGLVAQVVWHAVLPVLSLVLVSVAGPVLLMRNNMIEVLSEDYVTLARAKGLPPHVIRWSYTARTALLPLVTGLMLNLGNVVAGAVVTEVVFSYPGVGTLIYQAILSHDYPVLQGAFMLVAAAVIGANLVADLIYPVLDPRVSLD